MLKQLCIYKLPNSIFNYSATIYSFYLLKKITNADPFQVDEDTFDKISDLLKPSTDIWNKINEKTPLQEKSKLIKKLLYT